MTLLEQIEEQKKKPLSANDIPPTSIVKESTPQETTTTTEGDTTTRKYETYRENPLYNPNRAYTESGQLKSALEILSPLKPERKVDEEKLARNRAKLAAWGDAAKSLGQLAGRGYAPTDKLVANPTIAREMAKEDALRLQYLQDKENYNKSIAQLRMNDMQQQAAAAPKQYIKEEVSTTSKGDRTTTKSPSTSTRTTTDIKAYWDAQDKQAEAAQRASGKGDMFTYVTNDKGEITQFDKAQAYQAAAETVSMMSDKLTNGGSKSEKDLSVDDLNALQLLKAFQLSLSDNTLSDSGVRYILGLYYKGVADDLSYITSRENREMLEQLKNEEIARENKNFVTGQLGTDFTKPAKPTQAEAQENLKNLFQ